MLAAPAARYWAWYWISEPVRPADERLAFERLAAVPLGQARGGRVGGVALTIPSDSSWRRIVRNWGDPGYLIAAAPPGSRNYTYDMYCLRDLGVRVQASIGGGPLSLETAEYPPYGYSLDCRPAGLRFRAPQGSVVQIRFEVEGKSDRAADLIVVPYWLGAKDHLVGISIQEDLQTAATALGIAGAILITFAVFLFLRRPRSRAGQ
jgi:hypothetical protein